MIKFSTPGKIHLLGEHSVVYGKPALLTTVNLRVFVTISKGQNKHPLKQIIEPIVNKYLKLKTLPPYQLKIDSQLLIGSGLGSSAAVSAAYIAALLTFLRVKLDLNLINNLTFETEKVFHGNPSGADNSTVVFGPSFSIPHKLAKNFVLINTGRPKETTKEMVAHVKKLYQKKPKIVERFLENQERLVKQLPLILREANEKEFVRVIKEGEANLENIGVVSKQVAALIREIGKKGGAAKICGGGGKKGPTGILLTFHPTPKILEKIAKSHNLSYFKTALGAEGLRRET